MSDSQKSYLDQHSASSSADFLPLLSFDNDSGGRAQVSRVPQVQDSRSTSNKVRNAASKVGKAFSSLIPRTWSAPEIDEELTRWNECGPEEIHAQVTRAARRDFDVRFFANTSAASTAPEIVSHTKSKIKLKRLVDHLDSSSIASGVESHITASLKDRFDDIKRALDLYQASALAASHGVCSSYDYSMPDWREVESLASDVGTAVRIRAEHVSAERAVPINLDSGIANDVEEGMAPTTCRSLGV